MYCEYIYKPPGDVGSVCFTTKSSKLRWGRGGDYEQRNRYRTRRFFSWTENSGGAVNSVTSPQSVHSCCTVPTTRNTPPVFLVLPLPIDWTRKQNYYQHIYVMNHRLRRQLASWEVSLYGKLAWIPSKIFVSFSLSLSRLFFTDSNKSTDAHQLVRLFARKRRKGWRGAHRPLCWRATLPN
jgi:hypothetical protein